MAKLKAPLMSLGASGSLGKTLTFFSWKGINVVREWVKPTNPNTGRQITQRGFLTAAVAMVHTAQARATFMLDSDDQIANSNLAASIDRIMTWFNMMCKLWLDVKRAGKTPIIYSAGTTTDPLTTSVDLVMRINEETASDLAAGKFFMGLTRTNLIHAYAAGVAAGSHVQLIAEDCSAWLVAGAKFFWQFRPDAGDPCVGANSGIYYSYAT